MKIGTVVSVVLLLAIFLGVKYWVREANSQPADRASYVRISNKACVSEALKSGVTQYQAETYCKCVLDDIYAGKTINQMKEMDAEVINGTLPEKYDAIIVQCAGKALQ